MIVKPLEVALIGIAAGLVALVIVQRQEAAAGRSVAFDLGNIGQSVAEGATAAKNAFLEAIGMRGIRNNNPGNIRHSSIHWQGKSSTQTDPAFVQFDSPEYGIRALARLLDTYSTHYGLNTVRGIIGRYAPSNENDTASYVNSVAGALGVSPDQRIDVQANKTALVQAIIKHENGIQPYALATIETGVNLA